MTSQTKDVTDEFLTAMAESAVIAQGHSLPAVMHRVLVGPAVDVRDIRTTLGLTRAQFADRFGFPRRTVQEWEQGRRRPDQAVRAYLRVIAKNPAAVMAALADEP